MRYNVGEKLIGIHFRFEGLDALRNSGFSAPYMYGTFSAISEIEFAELEVVEHHRVSSEYDEEDTKDCHGYVLKRVEDGAVFYNQYPVASYGQTTDTGDRRFYIHIEDDPEQFNLLNRLKAGEELTVEYHLFTDYVRNVEEGVLKARETVNEPRPSAKDLNEQEWLKACNDRCYQEMFYVILSDLSRRLKIEFEKKFPGKTYTMEMRPLFKKQDGTLDESYKVLTCVIADKQ